MNFDFDLDLIWGVLFKFNFELIRFSSTTCWWVNFENNWEINWQCSIYSFTLICNRTQWACISCPFIWATWCKINCEYNSDIVGLKIKVYNAIDHISRCIEPIVVLANKMWAVKMKREHWKMTHNCNSRCWIITAYLFQHSKLMGRNIMYLLQIIHAFRNALKLNISTGEYG